MEDDRDKRKKCKRFFPPPFGKGGEGDFKNKCSIMISNLSLYHNT